ncbi:MAG: protein-(glutamine-N5) methyltransferase [Bacteroidetes bacterium OLB11]|nr:MAG: protein-(glutamine-N5) methyltransferase [Bacteroidetes bacterium OLB11]
MCPIKNIPIQYVLGYEWWGGMKLKVNQHVLIPRPETEELGNMVNQYIQTKEAQVISVIDIGTGSGCLPIFIKKKNPLVKVDAIDISDEALNVAKENAKREQVEIHFFQKDIFQKDIFVNKKYDIIVSNPPYILPEEKIDMHERVWANEPNVALFVTNHDPLQFYKAIAFFAMQYLKPDGKIFLEINQSFANEIFFYFHENHFFM